MKVFYTLFSFNVITDHGTVTLANGQMFVSYQIEMLPMPEEGVKNWSDYYGELEI